MVTLHNYACAIHNGGSACTCMTPIKQGSHTPATGGEVVAYLVADGRTYVDTVYPSLERAEKSQQSRNDGTVIKPLVLASALEAMTKERDALRARLEQVEGDAARYRWLKPRLRHRMEVAMDGSRRPSLDTRIGCAFFDTFTPLNAHWEKNQVELESAIDAALAAGGKHE